MSVAAPHPRVVIDDLTRTAKPGTVGVTGPTGSGKSRLLQVIFGAVPLESGSIELDGKPVDARAVGVLTQTHELIGGLTAVDNVAARLLARAAADRGRRGRLRTRPASRLALR